jgi:hypothetical protein
MTHSETPTERDGSGSCILCCNFLSPWSTHFDLLRRKGARSETAAGAKSSSQRLVVRVAQGFEFVQTLERLGGFERLVVDSGGVQAGTFPEWVLWNRNVAVY